MSPWTQCDIRDSVTAVSVLNKTPEPLHSDEDGGGTSDQLTEAHQQKKRKVTNVRDKYLIYLHIINQNWPNLTAHSVIRISSVRVKGGKTFNIGLMFWWSKEQTRVTVRFCFDSDESSQKSRPHSTVSWSGGAFAS